MSTQEKNSKRSRLFEEDKIIVNGKSILLHRCNVNSQITQHGSDINGRIWMDEFLRLFKKVR